MLIQEETKKSSESRAELEQQLASSTSTVAILQTEKAKLQTEVQESKKEQDDLLMLLADQDQKIHALKQKLKDLGEPVNCHHHRLHAIVAFLFCTVLHLCSLFLGHFFVTTLHSIITSTCFCEIYELKR